MLQTPDQLYEAIEQTINGQEATDVLKVLIFSAAECLAQLSEDSFDAKLVQEVQFMLLQAYVTLCESDTIPIQ